MKVEDFRVATASLERFSDADIEKFFLDTVIASEDDIETMLRTIGFHRPALLKKLNQKYVSPAR